MKRQWMTVETRVVAVTQMCAHGRIMLIPDFCLCGTDFKKGDKVRVKVEKLRRVKPASDKPEGAR
jgi:predicted RNA-binding protein with TRAM domain